MKKIVILILAVLLFGVATGCKGKRVVKVLVDYDEIWTANIKIDSTTQQHTGVGDKPFYLSLGDTRSNITVDAFKVNPTNLTLTVEILETFEPGFLYLESSEVMAWEKTFLVGIPAHVNYNFAESANQ